MYRNKKKHVKGVQSFCFCSLNMQKLWRYRCCRVVDLQLPNVNYKRTRKITRVNLMRKLKMKMKAARIFPNKEREIKSRELKTERK